jgi:HEAT repeat protein
LLAKAGIEAPRGAATPVIPAPMRESEPVEDARKLWAEGRLAPESSGHPAIRLPDSGTAARALADQCLRNLSSGEPARREQAARHLLAAPIPAAAPLLANALGAETDAKARAQMARALAACGGEGAADIVAQLQGISEPPLVRLAAVEALCTISSRARAALETAAQDPAAGVRRRAAALAAAEGLADLLARFSADADLSVRATVEAACREAPAPVSEPARDIAGEAVLAVQSAIFGLSEAELGERLGLPEQEAASIASGLLSARRIGRRGKRLVAAEGA